MHKRKGKDYYSCAIHCEMTDEDTIKKLHNVLGVGRISMRPIRGIRKPTWILSIQKQQEIFDTLIRIRPYLLQRRAIAAEEMFNYLEDKICGQNT